MKYTLHKDQRRELYEFTYPISKVIITKEDCILGRGEYHKKKDEIVMLVEGSGTIEIDGYKKDMILDKIYEIKRGERHTFILKEGSVLLEWATAFFDPNDMYQ